MTDLYVNGAGTLKASTVRDAQRAEKLLESMNIEKRPGVDYVFLDKHYVVHETPALGVSVQFVDNADLEMQFFPPHLDAQFLDAVGLSETLQSVIRDVLLRAFGSAERAPRVMGRPFMHNPLNQRILWHDRTRRGTDLHEITIVGLRKTSVWESVFQEIMRRVFDAETERHRKAMAPR